MGGGKGKEGGEGRKGRKIKGFIIRVSRIGALRGSYIVSFSALWGTQRNLIVSQRLKGKGRAVPGAEAFFGLDRA